MLFSRHKLLSRLPRSVDQTHSVAAAVHPRISAGMTVSNREKLQELCQAAGQQHLLQDWDSLVEEERQQLAADIQVREFVCSSASSKSQTCAMRSPSHAAAQSCRVWTSLSSTERCRPAKQLQHQHTPSVSLSEMLSRCKCVFEGAVALVAAEQTSCVSAYQGQGNRQHTLAIKFKHVLRKFWRVAEAAGSSLLHADLRMRASIDLWLCPAASISCSHASSTAQSSSHSCT